MFQVETGHPRSGCWRDLWELREKGLFQVSSLAAGAIFSSLHKAVSVCLHPYPLFFQQDHSVSKATHSAVLIVPHSTLSTTVRGSQAVSVRRDESSSWGNHCLHSLSASTVKGPLILRNICSIKMAQANVLGLMKRVSCGTVSSGGVVMCV